MALVANRIEERLVQASLQPDTWGQGMGDAFLEQHYYDHPFPKFSILLFDRKTSTDTYGHVVGIDSVRWDYDEVTRAARSRYHEVWAYAWIPGMSGYDLIKVEEEYTLYTCAGWLLGGPASERTTKAGWVIYDLLPKSLGLTPAQVATIKSKGLVTDDKGKKRYASEIEERVQIDTGRMWVAAKDSSAIVQKATAPQIALWRDPYYLKEVTVEDDWQKTVWITYEKDMLRPGPPKVSRTEQLKAPLKTEVPITPGVPKIKGSPPTITAKGGGASIMGIPRFYDAGKLAVRPEFYALYRRTVMEPTSNPSSDPFGIGSTSGTAGDHLVDTAVTDFSGAATSDLPPVGSTGDPALPTAPPADVWMRIGELPNLQLDPSKEGYATFVDTSCEPGATYEYTATAIIGNQESPMSGPLEAAVPAGVSSGIVVGVVENGDGSVSLDANRPPSAVPAGYGETVAMTVPAVFTQESGSGWSAGAIITDPQTLAKEIALRQFLRGQNQDTVTVGLTAALFNLERGQLVRTPSLSRETWGNDLHLSTSLVSDDLILEGFSIAFKRNGATVDVTGGALQLEVP